jgi:hypothetical protein
MGMMMLYKEKFCDTKSFVGPTKEDFRFCWTKTSMLIRSFTPPYILIFVSLFYFCFIFQCVIIIKMKVASWFEISLFNQFKWRFEQSLQQAIFCSVYSRQQSYITRNGSVFPHNNKWKRVRKLNFIVFYER